MKSFDYYEFTGIVVPGAIVLVGLMHFFPEYRQTIVGSDVTLGGFGLLAMVAYGVGHLTQAIGNVLEWVWWRFRGMPTDWARGADSALLAPAQRQALTAAISDKLGLTLSDPIEKLSKQDWFGITRQVYACVAGAGRNTRVDVFNGNYGLNRGLAAALVLCAVLALVSERGGVAVAGGLLALALVALYRMHRFGKHYARELFVQFLQVPKPQS